MLDITKLPAYFLKKYGRDKVAEVIGQKPAIVAMWEKASKFPLDAVQRLLEFDPEPFSEVVPLYPKPELGTGLAILVPLNGPIQPKAFDSLMQLYDKREMRYYRGAFNCLSVIRNSLAATFLRSPCEWAWWQDAGDTVVPAGDAEWFKEAADLPNLPDMFAGVNSIYRALVHNKTIVSCCYIGRKKGANPQFGGGELPDMRRLVKQGPQDRLIEVPWVGFGGVLTHRKVFEDIINVMGDELRMKPGGVGTMFNYEYAFFDPIDRETPGDDVPFGIRAGKAGHKCYVDLAIVGAHVGDRAFTYQDL